MLVEKIVSVHELDNLIVLFKVFETALFGNLKFIATCLSQRCEEVDLWSKRRVNLQRVNGGSVRT